MSARKRKSYKNVTVPFLDFNVKSQNSGAGLELNTLVKHNYSPERISVFYFIVKYLSALPFFLMKPNCKRHLKYTCKTLAFSFTGYGAEAKKWWGKFLVCFTHFCSLYKR